jgi:hypothetical protein
MGVNDSAIFNQLKKGQGETNERLDRIAAALERQNQLLERIAGAASPPPPAASTLPPPPAR